VKKQQMPVLFNPIGDWKHDLFHSMQARWQSLL